MHAAFRRFDVCLRHLALGKATFQVHFPHALLEFLVMLGIMLFVTNEVASQAEHPFSRKIESKIVQVSGKTVTIDLSKWNFLPKPGSRVTIQQDAQIRLMGEWRVTKLSKDSVLAEPVPDEQSGQPAVGYMVNFSAYVMDKKDFANSLTAIKLFRSKAEAGDARAQLVLGSQYKLIGDYPNAQQWLEKSCCAR